MKSLEVCAAVVRRGEAFLLATRPPGSRLAGKWEFPGGKLHPSETFQDGIRRELKEELDLPVLGASLLTTLQHDTADLNIRLLFLECQVNPTSEPHAREGQQFGWFTLDQMPSLDLAPADREFVEWLKAQPGSKASVRVRDG